MASSSGRRQTPHPQIFSPWQVHQARMTPSSFLRFVPVRPTPCCPSRESRYLILHWISYPLVSSHHEWILHMSRFSKFLTFRWPPSSSSFKMASCDTPFSRRSISILGFFNGWCGVSHLLPDVGWELSFCCITPILPILILHRGAWHLFSDARWSTVRALLQRLRMLLLRMPTTPKSHPGCRSRCWESLE